MEYAKFRRCLIKPFWNKNAQANLRPGLHNLLGVTELEKSQARRRRLSSFVQEKAGILRINGKLLEEMAAFYTLKEFIELLMFSGLPEEVEMIRGLALKAREYDHT